MENKSRGDGAEPATEAGRIQSLAVATRILELMAEGGGSARVTDLAFELGLTKARVSRHLATMSDLGLVTRDPGDRTYRIGLLIFQIAQKASQQLSVTQVAYEFLDGLRSEIGETVVLAVPSSADAGVVVEVLFGDGAISATVHRGETVRFPVSPAARVMAAFADNPPMLAKASRKTLAAQLDVIRERHYELQNPDTDDVAVLSAPVFNRRDELEACVSVVAPNTRRFESRLDVVVEALRRCAAEISFVMGSSRWVGRVDESPNS